MTMTTTERAEINRRNAQKSTGPRTPEGKQRSKFNAVKHGLTAATPVLPGEDPDAFRHRLDAWADALAPDDAVEHFLVEQAATTSWKIERADRAEAARLALAARDAPDERARRREADAYGLGEVLIGDVGPDADPILAQVVRQALVPGAKAGPAPRRAAAGLDHPRLLVGRLEATAEGCTWLIERWAELGAVLERGTAWDEEQLVRAVRLTGRCPLDLAGKGWDRHRSRRDVWGGAADEPGGAAERPESMRDVVLALERREARKTALRAADRRALGRQLVAELPADEAGERAALLGLVERTLGRLTGLAAAHRARCEAEAAERAASLSFEAGPEVERLWRYQFGCQRSLRRTLDTLLKLRREGRGAGRAARGDEDRSEVLPTILDEAAPARGTGILPVSPSGNGLEARAASAPGQQPAAENEARDEQDRDAAPAPLRDEAAATATAQTPLQDQATAPIATQPSLQDEATAPNVAQPSPQNEATAPEIDRPVLQDEATASDAGRTGSPVTAVVVALFAPLFSAGLAAAFGGSTVVHGPDSSPQRIGLYVLVTRPTIPSWQSVVFGDLGTALLLEGQADDGCPLPQPRRCFEGITNRAEDVLLTFGDRNLENRRFCCSDPAAADRSIGRRRSCGVGEDRAVDGDPHHGG
jgi:hypothetical protein